MNSPEKGVSIKCGPETCHNARVRCPNGESSYSAATLFGLLKP
jgi:hypothetical protein